MIKFVKFKDVTDSINACNHCHYGCNGTRDANNCGHWNECAGGYFVNKPPTQQRTRPRMGKHERLLRALLNSMNKSDLVHHSAFGLLSESNFNKCIAIKQAMEKKGKSQ